MCSKSQLKQISEQMAECYRRVYGKVWDFSADLGIENDVVVSLTVIPYDEYEDYRQVLPYYMNITKAGI